ncbi:outer membrane protein assembly factor BamE [Caenimonas aquaedulcis]|uniref:Outer membrane protein assembly factor BamE n=1 Tax=Caenimonas aquaedulcis TaxID=2793270 RepID=A0A931H5W4_9BURK|nr:outer membrane protein assembly factor BamE [Caenimonas aquaedulcis]MBG9389230.1 outer membrane protein assembly factor BamE [Caenimonas aquaedulcis]
MPVSHLPAARIALVLTACAAIAACGSFDNASQSIAGLVTPYKPEVVQGNFVSKEQAAALKPGLTRQQVREILGTPLVTSVFHADRWDYVFTLKRQGVAPQSRRLAVFFKGDQLDRTEGDEMPSEADFVATLDNKRRGAKVPPLEASEERLKQFSTGRTAAPAAPAAEPPAATSYPPLEAPAR